VTFCPRCGNRLPGSPPTQCTSCAYQVFVNARPTATVIVVQDRTSAELASGAGKEFLAIRRAIEPKYGRWELPGGFCDGWEHPADAAIREAKEELDVDVQLGQFVGMYLGRYDFQGESLPILDCVWLATITSGQISLAATEASEYAWFSVSNPPELAFETMDRALTDAQKFV
jgi:8-oxo-dGTP diphosphatase